VITYRIYTERKPNVGEIVSQYFDGFTLIPTEGYWKGKREESVIVEVIASGPMRQKVREMAETLKEINGQESVLVVESDAVVPQFV